MNFLEAVAELKRMHKDRNEIALKKKVEEASALLQEVKTNEAHRALLEALNELDEARSKFYHWIRPVQWKGAYQALCLDYEGCGLELVPGPGGGRAYCTSDVSCLLSEWELVDPGLVNSGE